MEEEIPFYKKPVNRAFMVLGVVILAYAILQYLSLNISPPEGAPASPETSLFTNIAIDAFLAFIGFFAWMFFFAQFILPVKTVSQRKSIFERFLAYITGFHGPAVFIENGIIHERENERNQNRGLGVVWLDSASAAMLRTQTKFTRVIGPGVHFTRRNEYIAATVDLHTLTQSVGPRETDQPFTIAKEHEDYAQVQARRWETSAMTRDGIEVVAIISVTFRINAAQGEGGTPFGFNEENTRRAITEALTQEAKTDAPIWSPLPAKMAADVWREYLRRFKLSQLFETPEKDETQTKLQLINTLINERLKKAAVRELDDFGKPIPKMDAKGRPILDASGQPQFTEVPSREFAKLQEMGYQVVSVNLKKLIFAPEIEERLIQQWSSLWLKNAQKEREQVERARKLSELKGAEEAQKDFAKNASSEISQVHPRNRADALAMLIQATRKGIIKNNALTRKMNTEPRDLQEMTNWLRDKSEGADE